MPFQPRVNDALEIGSAFYRVGAHPAAPAMPYAQEGRQATVFQLVSGERPAEGGAARALKVMKPRYRLPSLVAQAERLASYADLPGLEVCERVVLSPNSYPSTLREHADLRYAVLMPWIAGPTWMEIVLYQRELTAGQSLRLAGQLTRLLASMEERSVAHGDLSAPNVMLPGLSANAGTGVSPIALVDVEQLCGPGLSRPAALPGASAGYAHRTGADGLWSEQADHFAGAVLVAEMLGWCDDRVRNLRWGESYFDPAEMHQETSRARLLRATLHDRWGEHVADLFARAWRSATLAECPDFGEWSMALPDEPPPNATRRSYSSASQASERRTGAAAEAVPDRGGGVLLLTEQPAATGPGAATATAVLVDVARKLEEQGNAGGALEVYRAAGEIAQEGSALRQEAELIIQELGTGAAAFGTAAPAPVLGAAAPAPVPPMAPEASPETATNRPISLRPDRARTAASPVLAGVATIALALLLAAILLLPRLEGRQTALRTVPGAVPTSSPMVMPTITPSATPLPPSPTVEPTPAPATATSVQRQVGAGSPTPVATVVVAATSVATPAATTTGAAEPAAPAVANAPPPVIVIERQSAPPQAPPAETRLALPNIIGRSYADAGQILAQHGFAVTRAGDRASVRVPSGAVITESPDPGTLLPRGTAIVLTVSSGPPTVAVPALIGQSQTDAAGALNRAGLAFTVQQESSMVPEGVVLEQSPAAGAAVAPGSSVALTVSTPPTVAVPNVVGMPEGQAQATIQGAGLATTYANHGGQDPSIQIGSVESQSPQAGTVVPIGTVDYINVRS